MNNRSHKLIAVLIGALMLIGLVPVSALAIDIHIVKSNSLERELAVPYKDDVSQSIDPVDFYDNFENGFDWETIDQDRDGFNWEVSSWDDGIYYDGPMAAVSYSWFNSYALYPDNWMISPIIEIGEGRKYLSYFTSSANRVEYADIDEHWQVIVLNDHDALNGVVVEETTLSTANLDEHLIDISDFSGERVRIAFRHFDCFDEYTLIIDGVGVGDLLYDYTVTYSGAYIGEDYVSHGSSVTLPVLDTEGVHYTFTVDGEPWDGTNITSDVTVTVGLAVNVYTVEFYDLMAGEVLSTQQVEHYQAATAPEAPEHEHYTFTGWDADFSHVTSDMTVSAVYAPEEFTVVFTDGFGNVVSTQSVAYQTSAAEPPIPVVAGMTFTGWDADFSCIESDLTVNATWTPTICTVSFVGVYTATVFVDYGADCELPVLDSPSLHYTFTVNGEPWNGKNITSDVTVTVGVAVNATTFFTVTFLDWDGTVLKTETVSYGGAATAPANPTREGYTFIGWDVAFNNVTSNLTVTAVYEEDPAPAGLPGDVDCNGVVNMADLALAASYVQNSGEVTAQGILNGDMNGDGVLSAADLAALYALILG